MRRRLRSLFENESEFELSEIFSPLNRDDKTIEKTHRRYLDDYLEKHEYNPK